jgi:hypothetical protein
MPINKKVYASDTLVLPKVKIESFASESVAGPGSVPIGGMVTVMPDIDAVNAWQPPASGIIKDGFMRADGTAITAGHVALGCKLAVGTLLPNMIQKYPRGNTTSGSTGGNNLYTPAGTNSTSNVPAAGLSFSGNSTSYSVSVPAHYHSNGAGSTAATSVGVTGGTASGTFSSSSHTHGDGSLGTNIAFGGGYMWAAKDSSVAFTGDERVDMSLNTISGSFGGVGWRAVVTGSTDTPSATASVSSTAATMTGSNTVTGTFGLVTGGQNGNAAMTASGNNTPSGSITGTATAAAQTFTGTQASNEPAYVEVVWVIRVS